MWRNHWSRYAWQAWTSLNPALHQCDHVTRCYWWTCVTTSTTTTGSQPVSAGVDCQQRIIHIETVQLLWVFTTLICMSRMLYTMITISSTLSSVSSVSSVQSVSSSSCLWFTLQCCLLRHSVIIHLLSFSCRFILVITQKHWKQTDFIYAPETHQLP